MNLKSWASALIVFVSLHSTAAQPNHPCPTFEKASMNCNLEGFSVTLPNIKLSNSSDLGFFTNGFGIVTLTNDYNDLPDSCVFKGRATANRVADDFAPIDSVTRMNWYIDTSRKHQANYLLGNAYYESLWSYQCRLR